jgi:tetratricopeptide (TPR) repeat protein
VIAFEDANAAYGRAHDCAQSLDLIDEQLELEEAIGKLYLIQGEMIPAGEHFERALALATDPATRARLQGEAGNSLVATGNPRGLDHVREALSVLDPETNPLETANAIAIEGRFHHLAGQHEKALELLTRAAELAAPASTPDTVSLFAASVITTIYAWLAGAYQHSGLFSDGDVWARRAIEFGVSHNILIAQALGNEFLAEHAINSGDHAAGLEYARREIEIAEKLHSRERHAWARFSAAMNAMGGGNRDVAEGEFKTGIEIAESIGELRLNYSLL